MTITVEEAEQILAQPKERRGRGAAKPPLKELGADPGTGKPLLVKDGRFGPYVTDGETNASLRKGDDPEDRPRARPRAARRAPRQRPGDAPQAGARATLRRRRGGRTVLTTRVRQAS